MTVRILVGDCRSVLPKLPSASVQTCLTSPPYFNLRDYGVDAQTGLESTVDAYIETLVQVFQEVRRILRPDGTLWVVIGDAYSGSGKGRNSNGLHSVNAGDKQWTNKGSVQGRIERAQTKARATPNISGKNLLGVPWRLAFALQKDGWILRNDIIFAKRNPMPSPHRDRFTSSHEHIFLFAKQKTYFFDMEAVKEPAVSDHRSGNAYKRRERLSFRNRDGSPRGSGEPWTDVGGQRHPRDVWPLTVAGYKGAHYATFPLDLADRVLRAATSEAGQCAACGVPYRRALSKFTPTCACPPTNPVPQVVLDPFFGAGTTGLVAARLGRDCIGIELSRDYAELARARIMADA